MILLDQKIKHFERSWVYDAQKFKKIAAKLNEIKPNNDNRIMEIFKNLLKSAQTLEDMKQLNTLNKYMLSLTPDTVIILDLESKSAQLKDPIAMRFVAKYALLGFYTPYENAIPWAIEYLGHLETSVIPNLEEQLTKNPENQDLNEEIEELKNLIKIVKPSIVGLNIDNGEKIPEYGSARFNELVSNTIMKLPTVNVISNAFDLSRDLFKPEPTQESNINFTDNKNIENKEDSSQLSADNNENAISNASDLSRAPSESAPLIEEIIGKYKEKFPDFYKNLENNLQKSENMIPNYNYQDANKDEIELLHNLSKVQNYKFQQSN